MYDKFEQARSYLTKTFEDKEQAAEVEALSIRERWVRSKQAEPDERERVDPHHP